MMDFKKVLVCCPTSGHKNYCFEDWIENVLNFTYPNYKIRLFDNTDDAGINASNLNKFVGYMHGDIGDKFHAESTILKHNLKTKSVIAKMCFSHNDCREFALKNDYDYMLHLESDVFPPADVIERLMFHRKNIVGGLYYIDEGINRKAMVMEKLELSKNNITTFPSSYYGGEIRLFDGEIKRVAQIGLGCVLISKKALERIVFRYEPQRNAHPDTYFSEDCEMKNIPIHLDSSVVCRHENQSWGLYGIDFK